MIITSDTYPKEISGIDDRLISRFDSGLTVRDRAARAGNARRDSDAQGAVGIREPDRGRGVLRREEHLRSNVRELEGALRKILAYSKFHGREISIELTKEALKDLLTVQNRQISVENIQKTVADFYKHQGRGHVFEEASGEHRAAAADRDVSGEGAHAEEPAGNRRAVRRTRPHHGAARGAQDRRTSAARTPQLNHAAARARADAEGLGRAEVAGGKIDLFISKVAPNLVRRFFFQAQYGLTARRGRGRISRRTGAAWRPAGATARMSREMPGERLATAQAVISTKELYATGQDRTR